MKLVHSIVLLVAAAGVVFAASPVTFPDTAPGRHAAAYFEAFNRADAAALEAFFKSHLAASSLAGRPLGDRVNMNLGLRQEHGALTPLAITESTPDQIGVHCSSATGDMLDLTFECEPVAPNGLLGIRVAIGMGGGDAPGPGADHAGDGGGSQPRRVVVGGHDEGPPASSPRASDSEALAVWRAQLDSLTRADAFSGAVLVARGDAVLYRGAYGLASREKKIANRTATRFNLGSIDKMFTKVAIAQLVGQGKVRLDDTIDRYLPDYPREIASKVTVRQLLDHRGGIADIFGPAYDRVDKSTLRRVNDWVALFRDQPLRFEPGTRQQYSNGGFVLLGAIIEKASGEDYYDYIRRHVTGPLGMSATEWDASDAKVVNHAEGYTRDGAGPWRNNADTRPMRGSPAGGGYSNVDDLLRFTQALRASKLVPRALANQGFQELVPDEHGQIGAALGGGAPGINAAVSLEGPYTIIVLANLDPPTAEHAARALRGLLPIAAPRGGERRVVAAGDAMDPMEAAHTRPEHTHVPAAGVDLEMGRSGHLPVVSVMVNGRGPYRFGIDTGGGGLARVDSSLAAELGLETVGQAHASDPSGHNPVTVDLVSVASIEVGGARFDGIVAPVRKERLRLGEPIQGILGFNLFRDCLLTLDFPGNRVKIDRGELPAANGADVLDYSERHGIPSVRLQVDTTWVDADVDCGSMGGFQLPDRLADRLKLASELKVIGHARTVNNEFDLRGAQLDGSVHLGGLEFARPMVSFQPLFPMANVGSKVLSDFRLTFDQRNHRMRVARSGGSPGGAESRVAR